MGFEPRTSQLLDSKKYSQKVMGLNPNVNNYFILVQK